MFNKNTYTIYRNHPTRRAAMILCALLITLLPVGADTPVELGGDEFPITATYTIKSASNYQLYAASESANELSAEQNPGDARTETKYLFAFVPVTTDGTTTYYLYSVYAKKFVTSVSEKTTANLYDGNIGTMTPVYVYKPTNNYITTGKKDVYQYAIAFDNGAVSFASSNNGLSNESNNTNHVLQISSVNPAITDWNYLGSGGNYSLQIKVSETPFSDEALAEAQSSMKAYERTENPFGTETGQLTTDSKVYTLLAENGRYLSATNSGLGGSTSAGTNEQFLFFTKPAVTGSAKGEGGVRRADGATEVYLYSVGQKKFLTATKGWTASSADAAPIYVFSTNDAHDYSLAFSTNDTWATDRATIGTDNATSSSAPSKANRFKAEAVTTDAAQIAAEANTIYTGVYTRVTNLSDLNDSEGNQLSEEKVYYITSDAINAQNGHVIIGGSGSSLGWYTQNSGEGIDNLRSQYHASTRFAIVSCNDNFYLYSVNANKAVKDDATLVAGETSIQPIYLYATNNTDFPVAFGFSATWDAEGAKNIDGSCNGNDRGKLISSSTAIGSAKRFKLTVVTDDRYNLSDARTTLRGYYTPSTFSATGEGTKLVTDNKVYTLKSKAGKTLYANQYGQGLSVKTTSDADDGNVLAQFVFYQDPTDGSTNVYLYSVGRGQFVTSTNGFDKSAPQSAIHVFDTENTSYPYAFGFADTWTGGSVINAGSTLTFAPSSPLDANRFMATDVTTESPYVVGEAKDIYDGVYAMSSLEQLPCDITDLTKRIDINKVYYMYTDKGKRTSNASSENHTALYHGSNGMDKMATQFEGVGTEQNKGIEYWKNDRNGHFAFVTYNGHLYFYSVSASKAVSSSGSLVSGESLQPVYVYETHDREFPLALSFSSTGWAEANTATINGNGSNDVSRDNALSAFNRFKLLEMDDDSYSLATARKYLSVPNNVDEVITTDFHYKGVHGRDFKKRGTGSNDMQDVAEVHYYYYVNKGMAYDANSGSIPDKSLILDLPIMAYRGSGNGAIEPKGYFRWYDFNTDAMPSGNKLIKVGSDNVLNDIAAEEDDKFKELGWIAYNIAWDGNKDINKVGVAYKIPQDNYDSWTGDIIACDVSRYTDYSIPRNEKGEGDYSGGMGYGYRNLGGSDADKRQWETSTTDPSNGNKAYAFLHEPTLSERYVFHILPVKVIADTIKSALLSKEAYSSLTNEDQGILLWSVINKSGYNPTMNLRTKLNVYGIKNGNVGKLRNYWFYPLSDDYLKTHHVYNRGDGTDHDMSAYPGFAENATPVQATGLEWRVYNGDRSQYRIFLTSSTSQSFDLSLSMLNNGNPSSVWTKVDGKAGKSITLTQDSTCYIVGYLTNAAGKCPFFNAELQMNHYNYPKNDQQIKDGNLTERTTDFMTSHYGSPVALFSFDNENKTQDLSPVNSDESNRLTTEPSPFLQRQYGFLYTKLAHYYNSNSEYMNPTTPMHGDFCLYKKYGDLYDRTYMEQNGAQTGYFFFTDASDESRMIGYQDFEGSLCGGSQLFISAWVASYTSGDTKPELRFSLYGVEKDAEGNEISNKLYASLCTGKFVNNIEDWGNTKSNGVWYQVFGVVTLPANSDIGRYRFFRIGIDNYCDDTNGADYAVDDIRVYQKNAKLTAIPVPSLCDRPSYSNSNITVKIKGDYSVLKDNAGVTTNDQTVYYRFCLSDGTPVGGKDFYGTGLNNYGEAIVPATYSASATLSGEAGSGNQFEANGNIGLIDLVLVNKSFALNTDSTYYVSLATMTDDEGNPTEWGSPNDICTDYSQKFSFVRQEPITVDGGSNVQLTAPCETEDAIAKGDYTAIPLSVTVPDQVNGGTATLAGIPFDWYKGTRADFVTSKTEGTPSVSEALYHFRMVNATATELKEEDKDKTANDITYSDADYQVLKEAFEDGKLQLYSNALSSLAIPLGRTTFVAVVAKQTATATIAGHTVTYDLCMDPMEITVRALLNGPDLDLGRSDISYPQNQTYRSVRLGLPQLKEMTAATIEGTVDENKAPLLKTLRVPVSIRYFGRDVNNKKVEQVEDLLFFNSNTEDTDKKPWIYICGTNDPTVDLQGDNGKLKFATVSLKDNILLRTDTAINISNIQYDNLHEGYWYEMVFTFRRDYTNETGIEEKDKSSCQGETYLFVKVVPEYLTWNPTADNGLNTNWNNDANWMRSTAAELYDPSYKDYREASYKFQRFDSDGHVVMDADTDEDGYRRNSVVEKGEGDKLVGEAQPNSYVPMYFSKVTIPALSNRPYPMLGFIRRNEDLHIVLEMTNDKKHLPTDNIEYDFMAMPLSQVSTESYDNGSFWCANFDGNVCEQIQFKPGAELRNQQYLHYGMAWVEMEMPVNEWGTLTTPMKKLLAGDLYVPKTTARQTTPSFKPVTFDDIDAVDANGKPWVSEAVSGSAKYGLLGKAGKSPYSRLRMPVYQKLWGKSPNEYNGNTQTSTWTASDNPSYLLIYPEVEGGDNRNLQNGETYNQQRNGWSHVFNAVGYTNTTSYYNPEVYGRYNTGIGLAMKVGDDYATPSKETSDGWHGKTALVRLPKADTKFIFKKYDGSATEKEADDDKVVLDVSAFRDDNYRLGVDSSFVENAIGAVSLDASSMQPEDIYSQEVLDPDNGLPLVKPTDSLGQRYDLIGNPYVSTIRMKDFIDYNKDVMAQVQRKVVTGQDAYGNNVTETRWVYRIWILKNSVLYEYDPNNVNNVVNPGEAFFVKVKNPGVYPYRFTTRMQTDPTLSTPLEDLERESAGAKAYFITEPTDIGKAIEEGTLGNGMRACSPAPGWIGIVNDDGERSGRARIYTVDGRMVCALDCAASSMTRHYTGSGIFVVRMTTADGKTEVRKMAVR